MTDTRRRRCSNSLITHGHVYSGVGASQHHVETARRSSNGNSTTNSLSGSDANHQLVQVALMGAPFVGKTAMASQFLWGVFIESYVATEAESFNWIEYDVGSGDPVEQTLMLKVLELPGENEFPAMRHLAMEKSNGFLVLFDVSKRETWEHAQTICEDIRRINRHSPPVLIIGNKMDKVEEGDTTSAVDTREITRFVEAHRLLGYLPLTARDVEEVRHAFGTLVRSAMQPVVGTLARHSTPNAVNPQLISHLKKRRQSVPADLSHLPRASRQFDQKDFERIQAAAAREEESRKHKCSLM